MMNIIPRKFDLDDFFNHVLTVPKSEMKCDIYEKNNEYHIEMDIPSFNKNDVNIEVKDDYLTITAEKQQEQQEEEKNYIRRERTYGKYTRSFYVGDMESENIKAKFEHGTLNIIIPKKEQIENKKIIEIEE